MENKIVMVEKKELNIHTLTNDEIELLAWSRLLDERNQLKAIGKIEHMVKDKFSNCVCNTTIQIAITKTNI